MESVKTLNKNKLNKENIVWNSYPLLCTGCTFCKIQFRNRKFNISEKQNKKKTPFSRQGSLYSITLSLSLRIPEEVWQLGFGLIACNSSRISLAKANSVNSGVDCWEANSWHKICLFVLIGDAGKG